MQSDEDPPDGSATTAVVGKSPSTAARSAALTGEVRGLLPFVSQGLRLMVVLLILCGILYPVLILGIGQLAFPSQANGSLVRNAAGQIIGSTLIGQQFTSPYYFHGRPSAAGYDASNSSGSNIGPLNPQLVSGNGTQVTVAPGATPPAGGTPVPGHPNTYNIPGTYLGVQNYAAQFRAENGLTPDTPLPADIVTASGSGLDPDISVAAADFQVNRIVAARKALGGPSARITAARVRALIAKATEGRQLHFLGEPRVNVLVLNQALDAAFGVPPQSSTSAGR